MILQVTALSRLCIDYHEYYTSIQSTFKTDFLFFLLNNMLESQAKDNVLRVASNSPLILPPKERPIIKVLKMVGLTEKHSGSYIAWYE